MILKHHLGNTLRVLIFAGTNFRGRKKNLKNRISRFVRFLIFRGNLFSRLSLNLYLKQLTLKFWEDSSKIRDMFQKGKKNMLMDNSIINLD